MADIYSLSAAASTKEQFLESISYNTLERIRFPDPFHKQHVERKHTGEIITLISSLSPKQWQVRRSGSKLKEGWKEFVIEHRLRVGDKVLFTHEGNLVFSVTTFAPSGCRHCYARNKETNQDRDKAAFTQDGKCFTYRRNEDKEVNTQAGSTVGEKRKLVHGTQEAGNSAKAKSKAEAVIKGAGSSSFAGKKPKKDNITQSVESDCFYQTVTKSNVDKNSLYIPTKFARQNSLGDRKLGFLGLVNSGNVWGAAVTQCKDKRFQISGGWARFCKYNNLQVGDSCKFKIEPDSEDIMLNLVGVYKDEKKPVDRMVLPSCNIKEEQCELEEEYDPTIDAAATVLKMETTFSHFAGKSTIEKGQSSRK